MFLEPDMRPSPLQLSLQCLRDLEIKVRVKDTAETHCGYAAWHSVQGSPLGVFRQFNGGG